MEVFDIKQYITRFDKYSSFNSCLGTFSQVKFHFDIITEIFYCFQQAFEIVVISRIKLEVIHVEEVVNGMFVEFVAPV